MGPVSFSGMSTPATRNPKRDRKKQGQQQRRAAELAAIRRQQRNRRMVRTAVVAVVVVAALFLISSRGGKHKAGTTAAKATTSTTVAGASSATTPITCDTPSSENTDMKTKPKVTAPDKPATKLSCQDLVVGDGKEVAGGDTVTVDYVGVSQSTGKEFDTSWGKTPATFPLSGVIRGWTDGIPGMKVGGRRVLIIPGDQAYGPQGQPSAGIGPNDTLVFIVDVKDTKPSA